MSPEEQEQVEYWENGVFQCLLQKKMAEEILKDHKSWGNKVRIDGDKFHVEIKSKTGDKGKSNDVINDLPAGQPCRFVTSHHDSFWELYTLCVRQYLNQSNQIFS